MNLVQLEPFHLVLNYSYLFSYLKNYFDKRNIVKERNIKALVTAGPTREYIDPVRFITNKSSGKQGYEIAKSLSKRGFDIHDSHDEYNDDLNVIHPELIKRSFELSNGKPIFCFLQYSTIHKVTVSERLKKYEWNDKQFYENKKENLLNYDKVFKEAGNYAELIKNEIDKLNLKNDSIVIFFSDHGTGVGERFGERNYGVFTYDETIRTFYLIIGPSIQKNSISSKLLSSVQIFPTILDFAQIPHKIKTKSLANVAKGNDDEIEAEYVFSETGGLQGPFPSPKSPNVFCIKKQHFKLIYFSTPGDWALFDLKSDPNEENNLYGTNLDIETELKNKLLEWINRS